MWIQDFIEYLRCEKNFSEHTAEAYSRDLKEFESYMKSVDEGISWNNLPRDVVRQWMVDEMDSGKTARTVCRHLSSIRSFYKFLVRRQLVQTDPVHGLQGPKKSKPLPSYIREADLDRLFSGDYFPETLEGMRDRLILLTFYTTGMRRAELIGLDWTAVGFDDSQLRVTGKRNKQRIIPFGRELLCALADYKDALTEEFGILPDPVFVNLHSLHRMTPESVGRIVHNALSLVTTTGKRSPHVLRHSFATSMLNHDANLQSVKELMGHESLATTEIYTHTTFEELKKMYNQAHPRA